MNTNLYNHNITPLMKACSLHDKMPEILELIKNGADVNEMDKNGRTALIYAAKYNTNPDVVKVLIDNGADVNIVDEYRHFTPLMYASTHNPNPEIINILVQNGADINAVNLNKSTSLMFVNYDENPDVFLALLENGIDVTARNKQNKDIFEYSLEMYNNQELLEVLSKYDTRKNKTLDKNILLQTMFSSNPNIETIQRLIEQGADVNASDEYGFTPLMQAVGDNHYDVAKLLLENGAKVRAVNTLKDTAISILVNSKDFDVKMLDLLVENGASLKLKTSLRNNLLMCAIKNYPSVEKIKILIDRGLDVNNVNAGGETPLFEAISRNVDFEIIKLLIEKNADLNVKCFLGRTPLIEATIKSSYPELIHLLVKKGADINEKDNHDRTALYYINFNPNLNNTSAHDLIKKRSIDGTKNELQSELKKLN